MADLLLLLLRPRKKRKMKRNETWSGRYAAGVGSRLRLRPIELEPVSAGGYFLFIIRLSCASLCISHCLIYTDSACTLSLLSTFFFSFFSLRASSFCHCNAVATRVIIALTPRMGSIDTPSAYLYT